MIKKLTGADPALIEASNLFDVMNSPQQSKENLEYILSKLEKVQYFNQFIDQKFKGTTRSGQLDICSRLKMEYFKGGDLIFQENAPSNDKLYIIFYGSAVLMREKKMETLQQIQVPLPSTPNNELDKGSPQSQAMKLSQFFTIKKAANKLKVTANSKFISKFELNALETKYGQQFKIMRSGEGFGDRALRENLPRSLTVAAYSMDLYLVVLHKDDFLRFSQQFEKQIKEKQKLVFGVFSNINNEYSTARLETIIYSCQTVQYEKGQLLTIEGDVGEMFYIVQSGDITLYKKDEKRNIKLCIISTGNLLGEEIVINKTGLYEYSARVSSLQAKVMEIQANQFHTKFPDECRRQIIQDYRQKQSNRSQLFQQLIKELNTQQIQIQTAEGLQKLGKVDFNELKFRRINQESSSLYGASIESRACDIKLNKNFLKHYQNPTIQSYCVQSIVDTEKKISQTLRGDQIVSQENKFDEFDFGSMTQEQLKRRQHLFDSKFSVKKSYDNFLKPIPKVLPLAIKRDLLKSYKRTRKANYISLQHMGVTAYSFQKTKLVSSSSQTDLTKPTFIALRQSTEV
ncbi:hypothetical protein pb186bvf_013215 [Paramecium bursaria]